VPTLYAVLDAMRLRTSMRAAVVDLDMTAAAGLVSVSEVQGLLASRRSWRGVPGIRRAREAATLACDDSASPQETRLRLLWILDAQLPVPLVNQPVFDRAGRLLGVPDLLDAEAGLVVEYDGEHHRSPERHSKDVTREARFRDHGLEVTRVTGPDFRDPVRLEHRLRRARARAPFESEATRRWTLRP
jgi:hypothetical protein